MPKFFASLFSKKATGVWGGAPRFLLITIATITFSVIMFAIIIQAQSEIGHPIYIYRFSTRDHLLVPERRTIAYSSPEEMVRTVIHLIYDFPRNASLRQTIPSYLVIEEEIRIVDGIMTISFPYMYHNMAPYEEALFRASFVQTMLGLPFINIEGVRFLVNGQDLIGPFGEPLGVQTGERVLINPDVMPWMETTQELTLYFVSEAMDGLLSETRIVQVSPFEVERAIIEQLIAGPELAGRIFSIPSEVILLDISVEGSICTINFSEEFIDNFFGHQTWAELTLLSIVRSIMENNSNVTSVQFLIESERRDNFNGVPYFDTLFERDESG